MMRSVGGDYIIVDILNFGDDENCSCFLLNGQPHGLDFGLSEHIKALDVWGRHLGCHVVQCELYVCIDMYVCVHISEPFWEVGFYLPSSKTLRTFQS